MTVSRRRPERRRCRKRRFRDHKQAIATLHFILTIADTGTREHRPVRAYECDACKGYHLTSQEVWSAAA